MDGAFAELATWVGNHHGLFRWSDAMRAGVTEQQIRTLVAEGWCEAGRREVYRVRAAPRTGRQRILAEVWGHPPGAVASHRAAGFVWGLVGYHHPRPEVTVEFGRSQATGGNVRTSLWLPEAHTTTVDGIPITRVARTLFDLAGVEPKDRVEIALDDALSRRLCTLRQIHQVFFALARRGRRGTATMRVLLQQRGEGYVAPASALERLARAVFRQHGLTMPRFEIKLGDQDVIGRVDCTWPGVRLVVELDSRRWHGSASARERDRIRDNQLAAIGIRVIRVTWEDLKVRPAATVAQIQEAIDQAA